jgi:proliferating cell nuclear antigen
MEKLSLITENGIIAIGGRMKQIQALFNAVGSIKEECILKLTEEGLKLTTLDLSHICLVDLFIAKEDMDSFGYMKDLEVGINISDLNKFLKRGKIDDTLVFDFSQNKYLNIIFKNESRKKSRNFSLGHIEVEEEDLEMNGLIEMEFDNSLNMNFVDLKEIVGDADVVADVLEIEVKDESVIFSNNGTMGKYKNVMKSDQLNNFDVCNDSQGVFALSFLNQVLKSGLIFGTPNSKAYKSASVDLSLRTDVPLKIEVKLFGQSHLNYFLAPRVEEDEEEDDDYDDYGRPKEEDEITKIDREISNDLEFNEEMEKKELELEGIEIEMKDFSDLLIERNKLITGKRNKLTKSKKRAQKQVSKGDWEKANKTIEAMRKLNQDIDNQIDDVYDLKVNIYYLEQQFIMVNV